MGLRDKLKCSDGAARNIQKESPQAENKWWVERLKAEVKEAIDPEVRPYKPKVMRDSHGRVVAGTGAMNPGGRPLGPVRMIEYLTGGGEEMVVHAVRTLRGEITVVVVTKEGDAIEVGPSHKDQAAAREFLSNRFWGKSPETIRVEAAEANQERTVDVSAMSVEEMRILARARAKRLPEIVDAQLVDNTKILNESASGPAQQAGSPSERKDP